VLDWTGDEVVEWTKPKWYEKLAVLLVLIPVGILIAIPPIPLRIGLAIAFIVTWYFFLMFVIGDIKTRIMAWRIKRAAERRYKMKYALPRLFQKYSWLETYLREVRRAEELGFPYVPDIIVRDPATAKIEIRRTPPTRWIIQQTPPQQTTPLTPPEQAQEQTMAPPQPRQAPRRRRERRIPLPPELEDVYRVIKRLVEFLSIEETHTLFRIMAELKGYGRLTQDQAARQFEGLTRQTLQRYMERGEMPTTPSGVARMQKRIILPTLRRDLLENTTLLIEVLRRFADQYPDRTATIKQILRALMEPIEEPTTETEEEPPI